MDADRIVMIKPYQMAVFQDYRRTAQSELKDLQPHFAIKLGKFADYQQLFGGHDFEAVRLDEVRQLALENGRILISARGGAGKTTLMKRIQVQAIEKGDAAVLLELRGWVAGDDEALEPGKSSALGFFDRMIRRFTNNKLDAAALDLLPATVPKLILIDGLNETPGKTADHILNACDEAAAVFPGLSIIATDRLSRRGLARPDRWTHLNVLPVAKEEISRHVGAKFNNHAARSLLGIPFFLHRAIAGELRETPEQTVLQMISAHGSLNSTEMSTLKESAFKIYRDRKSRTFPILDIDQAIAQKLRASGILVLSNGEETSFAHHSMHDFLASMYLSETEFLWDARHRHNAFDAITFSASSFDSIASVLRILSSRAGGEKTSEVLQAVYDWNPYAAGYALSEAEATGAVCIAPGMRAIVLFMLGLRLYDHQRSTQQKARDALNMFDDQMSENILATANAPELIDLATGYDFEDQMFGSWLSVFSASVQTLSDPSYVDGIKENDSVRSWTLANMVKRLDDIAPIEGKLIELSLDQDFVVRWRSVHALGAAKSEAAIEALFARVFADGDSAEESEHVRYGAVRSLVEAALLSDETARERVLNRLHGELVRIRSDKYVLGELVSAVFADVESVPVGWADAVAPIFHWLIDQSSSAEEIEKWSLKLADLYNDYEAVAA